MTIDPHHQLKTDLYTTVPDLLICEAGGLPYRLVLWGGAISHDEATRRIDDYGATSMNYRIWTNPGVGMPGMVSVIQTDDKNAERTIASGLLSTCYRIITPAQAEAEEAEARSVFPWRLMCRTRPPVRGEIDHILDRRDGVIAYHTGYRPDAPRWAPDVCWLGTIYAIHVRDFTVAVLLKTAIGDCDLEGPGGIAAPEGDRRGRQCQGGRRHMTTSPLLFQKPARHGLLKRHGFCPIRHVGFARSIIS